MKFLKTFKIFEGFEDRDMTNSPNQISGNIDILTYEKAQEHLNIKKEDIYDILSNAIDEYGFIFECSYLDPTRMKNTKRRDSYFEKLPNYKHLDIILYKILSDKHQSSFVDIDKKEFDKLQDHIDEISDRFKDLGFAVEVKYDRHDLNGIELALLKNEEVTIDVIVIKIYKEI